MISRPRKNFDTALQVVQMIRDQSLSAGPVCRDLDLVDSACVAGGPIPSRGRPDKWGKAGRSRLSSTLSVNLSGRTSGYVRTIAC